MFKIDLRFQVLYSKYSQGTVPVGFRLEPQYPLFQNLQKIKFVASESTNIQPTVFSFKRFVGKSIVN